MEERDHLPIHLIDRHLAMLLSPEDKARVTQHCAQCEPCASRLARARDERKEYLERNPPIVRAVQLMTEATAEGKRESNLSWLLPVAGLALTALVVFIIRLPHGDSPYALTKSNRPLSFTVEREGVADRWTGTDGEFLRPGDRIRIRVNPGTRPFVTMFLMDHRGDLKRIWTGQLTRAGILPQDIQLDESTHPVRFIMVHAVKPVDEDMLRNQMALALARAMGDITRLHSIEVPGEPSAAIHSVLIWKSQPGKASDSPAAPR